jgi:hypothetical protein
MQKNTRLKQIIIYNIYMIIINDLFYINIYIFQIIKVLNYNRIRTFYVNHQFIEIHYFAHIINIYF